MASFAVPGAGCGKSGPPLPPLIRIPVAPGDFAAERRGDTVDLQFVVPSANTDGTRPANIERVDVYAITGPADLADAQFVKRGTKVGSVAVKSPRDPDAAVDPDDPTEEMEPPEGTGLDQGATAHVSERLSDSALRPSVAANTDRHDKAREPVFEGPLLGPGADTLARVYAGVGVATDGRRGAMSRRVAVPLVPPPPPPPEPAMTYDERAVTVRWMPVTLPGMVQESDRAEALPSTPIGVAVPTVGYNVYDVSPAPDASSDAPRSTGTKLTPTPVDASSFEDTRIAWDVRRCYTVRVVETIGRLAIESDAAPAACDTLTDTFPPAAPKGLQTVPGEGTINLIWEPSPETDVAGYIVLRGTTATELAPITPAPIADARFTDTVAPGSRFFYAVRAVDKAGNASAASAAVPETAR